MESELINIIRNYPKEVTQVDQFGQPILDWGTEPEIKPGIQILKFYLSEVSITRIVNITPTYTIKEDIEDPNSNLYYEISITMNFEPYYNGNNKMSLPFYYNGTRMLVEEMQIIFCRTGINSGSYQMKAINLNEEDLAFVHRALNEYKELMK